MVLETTWLIELLYQGLIRILLMMEGKIKFETDIVDGLENAPSSLERLFTGKNLGKLVVKVSEPD